MKRLLTWFEVPLDRKLKSFSKGMRQMTATVQAFMCDPELAVLDEPISGLDPLGHRSFNEFLLDEAERGLTCLHEFAHPERGGAHLPPGGSDPERGPGRGRSHRCYV